MGIGPDNKEKFEVRVVDKIRHGIKMSFKSFFSSPVYFLFYTLLTATAVGLFFGMDFGWKFFAILFFLGLLNISQFFYVKWYDNKDLSAVQDADEGREGAI